MWVGQLNVRCMSGNWIASVCRLCARAPNYRPTILLSCFTSIYIYARWLDPGPVLRTYQKGIVKLCLQYCLRFLLRWGNREHQSWRLWSSRLCMKISCIVRNGEQAVGWNLGCGNVMSVARSNSCPDKHVCLRTKDDGGDLVCSQFPCVCGDMTWSCRDLWMLPGWSCQ